MPRLRTDIQSLRGIAVLLVLAYHAKLGVFTHGYLGVDVFFVISGFLITGMVARDLDSGRFRFRDFYWRRAKRLLPAALVVFAATSAAAALLLTRAEQSSYFRQLVGALTFTANLVLWKQTSYFEEDAELKPLMHTWSLSLEEQFYLLLPLALWLTPRRLRLVAVLAGLVASAAACFALAPAHPTGVFYLLPTRAWELLLGAAGALTLPAGAAPAPARTPGPGGGRARSKAAGAAAAVLALVVVPAVSVDPVHPRLGAAAVCLATLAAIALRPTALARGPLARGLAAIGDVSYSLYLVHWPLLCFVRIVWLDTAPLLVRLLALAVSAALAAALHRFVEDPLRRARVRPSDFRVALVAGASAAVALVPLASLDAGAAARDWTDLRRFNYGLGAACDAGASFEPGPACRTTPSPRVLVWGDSFGMHLVPALAAGDVSLGIVQATRGECGPTLDLAPLVKGKLASAGDCLAFNRSVLEFVRRTPRLEYVVLSSSFELYLGDGVRLLTPSSLAASEPQAVARALADTARALRSEGRRVALVAPPPTTGADLGGCVERRRTGLLVAGNALLPDCSIDAAVYRERRRDVIEVSRRAAEQSGIGVVHLSELLCDGARCRVEEDGTPLYLDHGHLTYAGATLIGRRHRLLERVLAAAR